MDEQAHQFALSMMHCPSNNPGVFLCLSENCKPQSNPIICNQQNCQTCSSKQKSIHCKSKKMVLLKTFVESIASKSRSFSPNEGKSCDNIIKKIQELIDFLSSLRENYQKLSEYHGNTLEEYQFLQNIKNDNLSSLDHNFILKLQDSLNVNIFPKIESLDQELTKDMDEIKGYLAKKLQYAPIYCPNTVNFDKLTFQPDNKSVNFQLRNYKIAISSKIKAVSLRDIYCVRYSNLLEILNHKDIQSIQLDKLEQFTVKAIKEACNKYSKLKQVQIHGIIKCSDLISSLLRTPKISKVCLGQNLEIPLRDKIFNKQFSHYIERPHLPQPYPLNIKRQQLNKFYYWQQNLINHSNQILEQLTNVKYLSLISNAKDHLKLDNQILPYLYPKRQLIALRLRMINFGNNPHDLWKQLINLQRLEIQCCNNVSQAILQDLSKKLKKLREFEWHSLQQHKSPQILNFINNLSTIYTLQIKLAGPQVKQKYKESNVQFKVLTNLRCLYLQIQSFLNQAWISSLTKSSSIQELFIDLRYFHQQSQGFQKLAKIPRLTTLGLLSDLNQKQIISAIHRFKNLRSISINTWLSAENLVVLSKIQDKISYLSINMNQAGTCGTQLKNSFRNLKYLRQLRINFELHSGIKKRLDKRGISTIQKEYFGLLNPYFTNQQANKAQQSIRDQQQGSNGSIQYWNKQMQ